jgi:hypothetical protein
MVGVISQEIELFITTAVRTSNPTRIRLYCLVAVCSCPALVGYRNLDTQPANGQCLLVEDKKNSQGMYSAAEHCVAA